MTNGNIPAHQYGLDDEWEVFRLAGARSFSPNDLAARLGEAAEFIAVEGSPAGCVAGSRLDLLMHWIASDPAFGDRLSAALTSEPQRGGSEFRW